MHGRRTVLLRLDTLKNQSKSDLIKLHRLALILIYFGILHNNTNNSNEPLSLFSIRTAHFLVLWNEELNVQTCLSALLSPLFLRGKPSFCNAFAAASNSSSSLLSPVFSRSWYLSINLWTKFDKDIKYLVFDSLIWELIMERERVNMAISPTLSNPKDASDAYMVYLASEPPRLLKTALGEVYHINLKGC